MRLCAKLALFVLLLSLLTGQGLIHFTTQVVRRRILVSVERHARGELLAAAAAAAPAFRARGEALLLPKLESLRHSCDALHAAALDPEGRVLAHTNVAEKGRLLSDAPTREALGSPTPLTREIVLQGRPLLDMSVPVWSVPAQRDPEEFLLSQGTAPRGERLGVLRLRLPLEEPLALARAIDVQVRTVVGVCAAAAAGVLLLFLRGLLAPIRRLAAGMGRIRAGDYGTAIPAASRDEFGDLARGFNAMSQDLARTTVSKDFLNDILLSLQDALIVLAPDGRVMFANPAALDLFARAESQLPGTRAASLFEDAGDVLSDAGLERIHEAGTLRNLELRVARAGRASVPVLFSVSVLKSADGAVKGFIGSAKDLTEIKALEARMRQSEKLSAVGQLAAGVAHEINNPLGIILGFAQAVAEDLDDTGPLALPLKSIEREALRCKNLVADLLTFSRQGKPRSAPFDLNESVRKSLSLIAAGARVRAVEIVPELGAALVVRGDMNDIQQVLINLCGNALDAMPQGGRLSVRTRPGPENGRPHAILEVEDTGSGIPPEVLSKIFEPFFTTKDVGKGTGLGLSLVHEIVARHEGSISARSEPGAGTTFTVLLPLEVSHGS